MCLTRVSSWCTYFSNYLNSSYQATIRNSKEWIFREVAHLSKTCVYLRIGRDSLWGVEDDDTEETPTQAQNLVNHLIAAIQSQPEKAFYLEELNVGYNLPVQAVEKLLPVLQQYCPRLQKLHLDMTSQVEKNCKEIREEYEQKNTNIKVSIRRTDQYSVGTRYV